MAKDGLYYGAKAIQNNEDWAGSVERGVVSMNWLENAYTNSRNFLNHTFWIKWTSTLTIGRHKRIYNVHNRVNMAGTHKHVWDAFVRMRKDIKNDY